jgi:hypothetical protein
MLWEAALYNICMLKSHNGLSGVATVPLGECLPVNLLPALIGHRTYRALFMSGIGTCGALLMWDIAHVRRCSCRALRDSAAGGMTDACRLA